VSLKTSRLYLLIACAMTRRQAPTPATKKMLYSVTAVTGMEVDVFFS
jgi:hypothetical protein